MIPIARLNRLWFWWSMGLAIVLGVPQPAVWACQQDHATELSGLTVSEISEIVDGQPIDWLSEVAMRLWYRCLRQPRQEFARALTANDLKNLESWNTDPGAARLRVFRIAGRLKKLSRLALTPVEDFAQPSVAEIELSDGTLMHAGALMAPRKLPLDQRLDEPVSVSGFFVCWAKSGDREDGRQIAMMIAPRLEWYPEIVDPSLKLTSGQLALVRAGFDLGQLDTAAQFNRLPFQAAEQEAFDEMLRAVARLAREPADLETADRERIGLMDILHSPDELIGAAISLEGSIRRVTPVTEYYDSTGNRLKYYQLDLFAPLGETTIRMRNAAGNELTFKTRFPVTVNAVSLPDSVISQQDRQVRIEGFYYRFWSYESAQSADRGGQFTPLIFSTAVHAIRPDKAALNFWISGLFVSLLAVVGMVLIYVFWGERSRKRPGRNKSRPLPTQIMPP